MMTATEFQNRLTAFREAVEARLNEILPRETDRPAVLSQAMRHGVMSGGKRLRPILCLAAAEAVGGRFEDALCPACAIELLHSYTLVHDDLPAMDNDVERRGRPTVWKRFGEANGILAGDALLALAFRTAAGVPRNVVGVLEALGEGGVGVVQGQVEDLVLDRSDPEAVAYVYLHKTADLFVAAVTMGALAAGGTPTDVAALKEYAVNLGLAFQFEDDLLDGDSPYSHEETERLVREKTARAVAALVALPGNTMFLKSLAERLIGRKK